MSDKRNKINCAKCHNAKCALSGKAFNMAACTGYKSWTNYDKVRNMSVEKLAEVFQKVQRNQKLDTPWLEWLNAEVKDGTSD